MLLAAPAAATVYLSFDAGGFFPATVGLVAIVGLQLLVLRTVLADHPFEGLRGRLAVPAVGLAGLGLWQLASSGWSDSTARALIEFDRTLLYLVALVLGGTMARTGARLAWTIRLLFVALAFVGLAALASRVLPEVFGAGITGFNDRRLSYPLTYWNAVGIVAALGIVLGFHLTSSAREPLAVRIGAAALLPPLGAALLLTYSRGAMLAGLVGLAAYVLLGRARLLLTGVLAVVPTLGLALLAAYEAEELSDAQVVGTAAAVGPGEDLALLVVLCMVAAAVVRAGAVPLDRRLAHRPLQPLRRLGLPAWSGWAALGAAAAVAVVVAIASGAVSRAWDDFIDAGVNPLPGETRDRLTDTAGNGRGPQWEVAIDAFADDRLRGQGAASYEIAWYRERDEDTAIIDGHSLYLETLADLGIVGLLLILLAVGGVLAGLAAGIRGRHRTGYAALFAAGLTWALHAGIDWDWEMPATTVWFFAAGGAALAARARPGAPTFRAVNRAPVAVAFLVAAAAPFVVMTSSARLERASDAVRAGDCPTAKQEAIDALDYLGNRAESYAIIGLCDAAAGFPQPAVTALEKAVAEDPRYWEWHYELALVQAAAGTDPRPALRRALERNPRDEPARALLEQAERASRRDLMEAGRAAVVEALDARTLAIHSL